MEIIEVKTEPRDYKIGALTDDGKLIKVPFVVCDRNLERVDAKCYETPALAMDAAEAFEGLIK